MQTIPTGVPTFLISYKPSVCIKAVLEQTVLLHPLKHYLDNTSLQEEEDIGTILCAEHWCCSSSLLGYWTQSWTGHHSDAGYQQAGTHFADLRRMTSRVNPTWY